MKNNKTQLQPTKTPARVVEPGLKGGKETLEQTRERLYAQYTEWSKQNPPMAKLDDPQTIKTLNEWQLDLLEQAMGYIQNLKKIGMPQRSTVFGMAMVRPGLKVQDVLYLFVILHLFDNTRATKTVVKNGKAITTSGEAHFVMHDPVHPAQKISIPWQEIADHKGHLALFLREKFNDLPKLEDYKEHQHQRQLVHEVKVALEQAEGEVIAKTIAAQNPQLTNPEVAMATVAAQVNGQNKDVLPQIVARESFVSSSEKARIQSLFETYHQALAQCVKDDGTLDGHKITRVLLKEYEAVRKEDDYKAQASWGITKAGKQVGSDLKTAFTEFDFSQFWGEGVERHRSRAETFRMALGLNGTELSNTKTVEQKIKRWSERLNGVKPEVFNQWIPRAFDGVRIEESEGIVSLDVSSDLGVEDQTFLRNKVRSIPEAYLGTALANTYVRLLGEGKTAKSFNQWRIENSDETYLQKAVYAVYGLYLKIHKAVQNFGWFKDWFGEYEPKENNHLGYGLDTALSEHDLKKLKTLESEGKLQQKGDQYQVRLNEQGELLNAHDKGGHLHEFTLSDLEDQTVDNYLADQREMVKALPERNKEDDKALKAFRTFITKDLEMSFSFDEKEHDSFTVGAMRLERASDSLYWTIESGVFTGKNKFKGLEEALVAAAVIEKARDTLTNGYLRHWTEYRLDMSLFNEYDVINEKGTFSGDWWDTSSIEWDPDGYFMSSDVPILTSAQVKTIGLKTQGRITHARLIQLLHETFYGASN